MMIGACLLDIVAVEAVYHIVVIADLDPEPCVGACPSAGNILIVYVESVKAKTRCSCGAELSGYIVKEKSVYIVGMEHTVSYEQVVLSGVYSVNDRLELLALALAEKRLCYFNSPAVCFLLSSFLCLRLSMTMTLAPPSDLPEFTITPSLSKV